MPQGKSIFSSLFVQVALGLSALILASSLAYYLGVYIPVRDKRIAIEKEEKEKEAREEKERKESEAREERERQQSEAEYEREHKQREAEFIKERQQREASEAREERERQQRNAEYVRESKENERRLNIANCQLAVQKDYEATWDNTCLNLGRHYGCLLPRESAERLDRFVKEKKEECYRFYK